MRNTRCARRVGVLGCAVVIACGLAAREGRAQSPPTTQSYDTLVGGPSLITIPGLDPVQLQMAHLIDNVCPNVNQLPQRTAAQVQLANVCNNMVGTAVVLQGGTNPLGLPSLPGVSLNDVKNLLSQINGGAETVVPTNQTSLLRSVQAGAISSRLTILHTRMLSQANGSGAPATVLAVNDGDLPQETSPRVQLSQNSDTSTPSEMAFWAGKLGVYLNAIGQFGSSDTTGNQNGYSFNNEGFLAGADYQILPNLALGLAFGYTYSDTDFATSPTSAPGQFLHGNLFQGNLYATWYATDALYVDGMFAIGGGGNDSSRTVITPIPGSTNSTATGNFGTRTYGLTLGGGYNFPIGALTLTPTLRMEYHRITSDGFTETGAGALDLTYGNSAQNEVLSFLGGQASYAVSTGFGVITPTVRFNWAHQYNNGNALVSIAYSSDPLPVATVSLAGDPAARNYYDMGVGVAMQLAGSLSGFLNYDAILGLNHTSFNSFTAGLRYGF